MKLELDDGMAVLARTPGVLNSLLWGLPEPWQLNNEGRGTWSPFDVLGHLVHGEKTDWIPRARIILDQTGNPAFEPFDRFAQEEDSRGKSVADLLTEFEEWRSLNLDALAAMGLTEEELALEGVHPAFGNVTLRQLLSTWVVHDLGHIAQMTRAMAGNYATEVGPWKQYLGILGRLT